MTLQPTQAPEEATFDTLPEVDTAEQTTRFLKPSQVREMTGLPLDLIYAALTSGELKAVNAARPPRPGKRHTPRWYIDPKDLWAWIEKLKTRTGGNN